MNYKCNYGGILQCLALQKTLQKMGAEVEVIKFSSNKKGNVMKKLKLLVTDFSFSTYINWLYDSICNVVAKLTGRQQSLPKTLLVKCSSFITEHINYTALCDEQTIGTLIQELNLDVIVIGSDKVWGAVADEQLVYFGDWIPQFNGRIVSYAACSSRINIPVFNRDKLSNLLSRFFAISVRDKHTFELIQPYTEKNVSIVADPTLLYDFDEYIIEEKAQAYILTYILGREIRGGHKKMIEKIKDAVGDVPVKAVVLANESTDIVDIADEVIYDASPSEWLTLIKNASFVYTDSFHGIMFSLKFHKRFIAYYRELNRASRLIDLRNELGIHVFIVSSVEEAIDKQSFSSLINESVYVKLDSMRESSLKFLGLIS